MMKNFYREYGAGLLMYATKLTIFWYIVAVTINIILPGFVSNYINMTFFLWCAIVSGAIYALNMQRIQKQ